MPKTDDVGTAALDLLRLLDKFERGTLTGTTAIAKVGAALDAATAKERERCAKRLDLLVERIKHSSHRDGIGMGDYFSGFVDETYDQDQLK